jgi:hypothetical protein
MKMQTRNGISGAVLLVVYYEENSVATGRAAVQVVAHSSTPVQPATTCFYKNELDALIPLDSTIHRLVSCIGHVRTSNGFSI